MKTVELNAKVREVKGKGAAKKLRGKGLIPAVVYGAGTESVSLELNLKAFESVIHTQAGENVLIGLKIEGSKDKKDKTVLITEIQHDPVSDRIRHVDFKIISLTEKITTKVPIHEKGEAPGVKEGGVLDHAHREVEVECLPTDIPDRIEVDISNLKISDAVLAKDLVLPRGVTLVIGPDEVILKVLAPKKEEVAVEALPGEAKAEPEVITAKKPVEGEAAEAGKEAKAAPKKE